MLRRDNLTDDRNRMRRLRDPGHLGRAPFRLWLGNVLGRIYVDHGKFVCRVGLPFQECQSAPQYPVLLLLMHNLPGIAHYDRALWDVIASIFIIFISRVGDT